MKKFLALLTVAVLTLSLLVGCGGQQAAQSADSAPSKAAPVAETAPAEEEAAASAEEASYTASDLVGAWAFASAVSLEDGSSMNPVEYAAAMEFPEEVLTDGALMLILTFDNDGKVTSDMSGFPVDKGTYEFKDGNTVVMTFEDTGDEEVEMADVLLDGEMTTTLAMTDMELNTTFLYTKLPE